MLEAITVKAANRGGAANKINFTSIHRTVASGLLGTIELDRKCAKSYVRRSYHQTLSKHFHLCHTKGVFTQPILSADIRTQTATQSPHD